MWQQCDHVKYFNFLQKQAVFEFFTFWKRTKTALLCDWDNTEKNSWKCQKLNNANSYHLYAILPVASVWLITIKPMHCTKTMSPVFVPHPFVYIARRIAASAKSLSDVVDPISIIVWFTISIVFQMSLKTYGRPIANSGCEHECWQLTCQFPTWHWLCAASTTAAT